MDRRNFIKRATAATAGMVLPTILPSGRLFAATGSRKVNHVVFCLFAGGVRSLESIWQNDGNLMPAMLNGNSSISSDISGSIDAMPSSPLSSPLQTQGTLFTSFKYDQGPTGHFNGHVAALTGQHTTNALSLRNRFPLPTIFELYRKHNSPQMAAKNAWWISKSNVLYPSLNYSAHPNYGASFGANHIAPNSFFKYAISNSLQHDIDFTATKAEDVENLKAYLNSNFNSTVTLNDGIRNSPAHRDEITAWMKTVQQQVTGGLTGNPWGITSGMNSDQKNLYFAEELIKEFKPELTVVNLTGVDTAHSNFSGYCNALHRADYGVSHLWDTIQNTPGMANDTVMIVMPEIGRNLVDNNILDANGRPALDHTSGDPMCRDIFCLVAGPSQVIAQNKVVNSPGGRSVDVVPTIANLLGFDLDIPIALPGSVLQEAFQ
jgi:hypothetical protein